MPRYDYECDSCHHRFELKQSFDSEPVATCPQCEHTARRKFHSVPVVFKGSGWYVNDYGKRGTAAATESKDSADSTAKSDGDGDAKSAKKSGAKAKSDTKTEGGSGSTAESGAKAKSEASKAKSD